VSGVTEHREVEYKYRVPANLEIDVAALLRQLVSSVSVEPQRSMFATYYDTSNLTLLRWGITLRYRTGGGDDGWHMKIPGDESASTVVRDEIRIDADPGAVPIQLASIVSPLIRRQEILALAVVHTERQPFLVTGQSGERLLEVVDDSVEVGAPGDRPTSRFREIEVELLSDDALVLARSIGDALVAAGVAGSSVSKAAAALGRRASEPPDVPVVHYPDHDAPAIDALQAIFSRYVRDLLLADVGVRRGRPDSVHQMRVACRRLRGALATFRPLLDGDATTFLREELAWLATELGHVRDTEVQIAVLGEAITDEETLAFIMQHLTQRLRAAESSSLAALRSDRHDFLIEDLILLVGEPPVSPSAFESVTAAIAPCVAKPWRKLARSVERSSGVADGETWHRIRINAKRARYAVEAVAPMFGSDYRRLGKSLSWVTDTLGSRQDAQVSVLTLQEIAAQAPAEIAYRLGQYAARREMTGDSDVRMFLERWPAIAEQARLLGLD